MKMLILFCCLTDILTLTIPTTEELHHLRFNPDDYEFLETEVKPENGLNEDETDEIEICPEINERQVNGGIKPKYELDPNLFITPVYIWGPSSQLQGLREAIGVAIRLNRTLLLPPFLTHQTDSSGGDNPVPVDIRLDIPKLRELLSIGFTDDLQCRQSDVVFLARGIYNKPTDPSVMMERVKRIENFEKATSMKVIRRNEETNDIDEKSPFLERSIPVTRSPKVSGAGVQLSTVLKIHTMNYLKFYSSSSYILALLEHSLIFSFVILHFLGDEKITRKQFWSKISEKRSF
jgi:hypothetical protein